MNSTSQLRESLNNYFFVVSVQLYMNTVSVRFIGTLLSSACCWAAPDLGGEKIRLNQRFIGSTSGYKADNEMATVLKDWPGTGFKERFALCILTL